MKSLILSVKPQYVCDILNEKKTIEIRKSYPHCDLPIKVYIYCTKDKDLLYDDYPNVLNRFKHSKNYTLKNYLNGKVVACFTLDKVEEINGMYDEFCREYCFDNEFELLKNSCLSLEKIGNYLKVYNNNDYAKVGYAWHISNLEIFDTPKELSEFVDCKNKNCIRPLTYACNFCSQLKRLTKAPQSWCYVED